MMTFQSGYIQLEKSDVGQHGVDKWSGFRLDVTHVEEATTYWLAHPVAHQELMQKTLYNKMGIIDRVTMLLTESHLNITI